MQAHGCKTIVFSSSATVYGQPEQLPIGEDAKLSATSPYGATKLVSEDILRDLERCRSGVARRPAALLQSGRRARERNDRRGPARRAEQPDAVRRPGGGRQATGPAGVRRRLRHARRHRRARLHARDGPRRGPCRGARSPARGRRIAHGQPRHRPRHERARARPRVRARERPARCPTEIVGRRPGDVAACYADPSLAAQTIGWRAKRDLDAMCADSWRWQAANPNGYGS